MLGLLLRASHSVEYSINVNELTISGTGYIDKDGVRSKGNYKTIEKVIIKEGPNQIRIQAFLECYCLKEINIPKSVIDITQPFRSCERLDTITVDPDNEKFCNDSQSNLYSKDKKFLIRAAVKENLVISDKVETIIQDSFNGRDFNYGNIVFPKSVKTIEYGAFDCGHFKEISFQSVSSLEIMEGFRWSHIEKLIIPNSVTTIYKDAFYKANIGEILFESGSHLTTISEYGFNQLNTDKIELPDSLVTIEQYAFKESTITKISIGEKCSSIADTSFIGCKNLNKITVSDSNQNYASNDGTLTDKSQTEILFIPLNNATVTIGSSITKIGKTLLQSLTQLTEVILDNNPTFKTENGVLYNSDYTELIAVCGGVKEVAAREEVKTIGEFAAYSCSLLSSFTFNGEKTTHIKKNAFTLSAINSFEIPNNVKTIDEKAFSQTKQLTKIKINEQSLLETVETFGFFESNITSFFFGKNIRMVGYQAFSFCRNLEKITFHPEFSLKSFQTNAFYVNGIVNLNMPSSLTTISISCFQSSEKLETIVFSEDSLLESIGEKAFSECQCLKSVVLPRSCATINSECFASCKNLSSFTHFVTSIKNQAFKDCDSLTSFNFSATQGLLEPGIFKGCHNLVEFFVADNPVLKSIDGIVFTFNETILLLFPPGKELATIPAKTISFADNAFESSPKLKYVAFFSGSNLETIGRSAFYKCLQLKQIQFPAKLETIKSNSFEGCVSIDTVYFPVSLKTIEEGAFSGCTNLKSVKYCGTNAITGKNVFDGKVKVSVTDLYKGNTFCSNDIIRRLSYNCEIKTEFLITCKDNTMHLSFKFMTLTLMFLL